MAPACWCRSRRGRALRRGAGAVAQLAGQRRLMQVTASMLRAWLTISAEGEVKSVAELDVADQSGRRRERWRRCRQHHHRSRQRRREGGRRSVGQRSTRCRRPAQLAEFYVRWRCSPTTTERQRTPWLNTTAPRPRAAARMSPAPWSAESARAGPRARWSRFPSRPGLAIAYAQFAAHGLMADDYDGDHDVAGAPRARSRSKLDVAALALGDLYRQAITLTRRSPPRQGAGKVDAPAGLGSSRSRILSAAGRSAEAEAILLRKLIDGDGSDICRRPAARPVLFAATTRSKMRPKVYGVTMNRIGTLEPEEELVAVLL